MRLLGKLLVFLIPATLLMMGAVTFWSGRALSRGLIQEVESLGISNAGELADGIAPVFRSGTESRILPLLQQTRERSAGTYALVLDQTGTVVAHTNVNEKGKVYADAVTLDALRSQQVQIRELKTDDGPILDIAVPVWLRPKSEEFLFSAGQESGQARLGTVRLGLPLDRTNRLRERIFFRQAGATLLAMGVLTLSLVLFIMRRILQPVRLLSAATAMISTGRYGTQIPAWSDDELGELARAFNLMSRTLASTTVYRDAILGNMVDALFVLDPRGTVESINPAGTRLLGYAAEELLGRPLPFLPSPEQSRTLGTRLFECHQGRPIVDLETSITAKSGETIPVLLSASAFKNQDGEAAKVIGLLRDLRERKKLEAQMLQTEKLSALGQMVAGVAHDFNNLVAAILGNCGFLLRDIGKDDPRHADVEEIRKAGERAANLTRQLLAFSRKQVLHPRTLDLNAAVTENKELLRRLIGERVHLTLALAAEPALVNADPSQVTQIIMNLATNARDAMPEGGRLTVATRDIEFSSEQVLDQGGTIGPGRYVLLTVADTGSGIDAGILGRIFEPFFTTKGIGQGTGLGLSTVYGIVKQSGGSIDVQSAPGRGTTFSVFLPRASAALPDGEGEGKRRTKKRRCTVLLVEDEGIVLRATARILEDAGHAVLKAASAREALEHSGKDFDLLLTDIILPDISGMELGDRMKEAKPDIRIIYMSGYTDDPRIREVLSRPKSRFLQKPFTAEALLAQVQKAMAAERL